MSDQVVGNSTESAELSGLEESGNSQASAAWCGEQKQVPNFDGTSGHARCSKCHIKHHSFECCKDGLGYRETAEQSADQGDTDLMDAETTCFKCNKRGHSVRNCRNARFEDIESSMDRGHLQITEAQKNECAAATDPRGQSERSGSHVIDSSPRLPEGIHGRPELSKILENLAYKESQPETTGDAVTVGMNKFGSDMETVSVNGALNLPAATVEESPMTNDLKHRYCPDDSFSDLKVKTKDGVIFSGHRFILAAKSSVFRRLIDEHIKLEGFNGEILMDTVHSKPFVILLHWMYTGELHEDVENVLEEVVEICAAFEVGDLLALLEQRLIRSCTKDNMVRLSALALRSGMNIAFREIFDFMKRNLGGGGGDAGTEEKTGAQ